MQWEDAFFKYIISQKVESSSDVNWDFLLKEKPFLTKTQIHIVLINTRNKYRSRIPTGRSAPKWIEERKREINQIYDDMMKEKSE